MSNDNKAPTFASAAEAAELAVNRLRDAVAHQGDPMLDAGTGYLTKHLNEIAQELRSLSSEFDD